METKRDNKYWEKFIRKNHPCYMRKALSITECLEDAEDIVWSVYANLFESEYNDESLGKVGLKAVINGCYNLHHYNNRQRRIPPSNAITTVDALQEPGYMRDQFGVFMVDPITNEHSIHPVDIKESISAIKDTLTDREYKMAMMAASGYKRTEISEEVGLARSSMQKSMNSIRKKLSPIRKELAV
jgi:DNA-directed RNA polymerase specialized sigma24 family protein